MNESQTTTLRVALVTGAGSGIGRAVAVALSRAGYSVALAGRGEEALRGTGELLSTAWWALPCDLADTRAAARLAGRAAECAGRLDVVVNNAAAAHPAEIHLARPEEIAHLFAVNGAGPTALVSAAWPHLVSAAGAAGRATVVNISSMATIDPFPNLYAYAASKAGLNVLALASHKAGKRHKIRAFAIAPGAVETQMLRRVVSEAALPASRTLTPERVAEVVLACVSGEMDDRSGETILLPSP